MKLILIVLTVFSMTAQAFSNSSEDIVKILMDENIINTIGNAEIQNITKAGNRRYEVTFDGCMLSVAVVSTCAGRNCESEVKFSSGDVNCLPPGSSIGN